MQFSYTTKMAEELKFLKITYHVGSADKTKINAYLKMPSPIYAVLLRELALCLFDQHKQKETEVRTYWIDEDGDEIEVVNQCDYEIFMSKRSEHRHLQVAPLHVAAEKDSAAKNENDTDNVDPNAKNVHHRIECDGCKMAPIVGFRYKCIQCPNYDLCEKCEMKHMHAEHMMVRMPNQNSPNVIEASIIGRGSRRHHKHGVNINACPFAFGNDMSSPGGNCRSPKAGSGEGIGNKTPGDGGKDHHHGRHGRKHQRRQMQNGIFTHLYNMMQDLAEGGGPALEEDLENDAKIAAAATAAHESAHEAAHDAAIKAASAVASATVAATAAAASAATQAAFSFSPETSAPEPPKNTGTKPKTPPPTPNNTKEPDFTQTKQTTNDTATPKNSEDKEKVTDTTPVLNSPIFENVSQYVDPQYMKAGIQILNNFSEMFAKMLDPMEAANGGGAQCPFQQQRKSSASSTASSNASMASSTSSTSNIAAQQSQPQTQTQTAATVTLEISGAVGGISNEAVSKPESKLNSTEQTPERRRSQSEETDWQIIDQQPIIERSIETLVDISPSGGSPKTPIKVPNVQTINYVQLSKDLQAHIDQEKQKEQQAKAATVEPQVKTTPVAPPPETATPPLAAAATPLIAAPEEKRNIPIYHTNQHINNAVHAMMAMGFSNEGAWLTQLLESVNGSIPQALDLMSGAGRNK